MMIKYFADRVKAEQNWYNQIYLVYLVKQANIKAPGSKISIENILRDFLTPSVLQYKFKL